MGRNRRCKRTFERAVRLAAEHVNLYRYLFTFVEEIVINVRIAVANESAALFYDLEDPAKGLQFAGQSLIRVRGCTIETSCRIALVAVLTMHLSSPSDVRKSPPRDRRRA